MKNYIMILSLIAIVFLTVQPTYAVEYHDLNQDCDVCHDMYSNRTKELKQESIAAVAPIALDSGNYIHGNFAANSAGCAVCHVTHSAQSPYLLNEDYDITRLCLACHGYSTFMSQYDVYYGMVRGNDGVWRPSSAGGFYQNADPYSDWTKSTTATFRWSTSQHNVFSADITKLSSGQIDGDIPGGSNPWVGEFKCTNCHDPHAGGRYPANASEPNNNPRLLRKYLLNSEVETKVNMKIDYEYASDLPGLHTYQTIEYGKGFNQWCGGCHDVFNTEGLDRTATSGIDNGMGEMKYRHKVGVLLSSTTHPTFNTSLQDGIPLPTTTNGDRDVASSTTGYLSCLSCHRAHGTSVNEITYTRYKPYDSVTKYLDTSTGLERGGQEVRDIVSEFDGASALLRLPNRDACFNCHGAAQYNTHQGTDKYGVGY